MWKVFASSLTVLCNAASVCSKMNVRLQPNLFATEYEYSRIGLLSNSDETVGRSLPALCALVFYGSILSRHPCRVRVIESRACLRGSNDFVSVVCT